MSLLTWYQERLWIGVDTTVLFGQHKNEGIKLLENQFKLPARVKELIPHTDHLEIVSSTSRYAILGDDPLSYHLIKLS